jgi:SAF domain
MNARSGQGIMPVAEPDHARRVQVPGWRDPRLLIGLVLVFASIAIGARVIAAADRTTPVFAAARTLPTGTAVTPEQLTVVQMRLTGTSAQYLQARQPVPAGQVVLRTVGAGEPVPVAALGDAGQVRLRPVVIPIDGPVPDQLSPGGLVDIWAAAKADGASAGGYLDSQRIASAAEISRVDAGSGGLAAGTDAAVQVLLTPDALPAVLNALAGDARIAVLPIPGVPPAAGSAGQAGS